MRERQTSNATELFARAFECFPIDSLAHQQMAPFVERLGDVSFSLKSGRKNSNQLDSDFDAQLLAKFLSLGAIQERLTLIDDVKKQYDCVFSLNGERVVVEVEKTNREKILYDLLKCHMYLNSGADFALLFLPKNYIHSVGEWNLFNTGCKRYDQCLKYDFGLTFYFKRVLLVGYEVASTDGKRLRKGTRRQLILREPDGDRRNKQAGS